MVMGEAGVVWREKREPLIESSEALFGKELKSRIQVGKQQNDTT
jgi:hypothetical protein